MSDFDRIFNPRLEKAVKAISLLENGIRYKPTSEQASDTVKQLHKAVEIIQSVYNVSTPVVSEVSEVSEVSDADTTEMSASVVAPEGWKQNHIIFNVSNIPENQLSSYVTQILARMCERFDTES